MSLRADVTEVVPASKPKRKHHVWLIIIIVLLAIILAAGIGLYVFVRTLGITFVDIEDANKGGGSDIYAGLDEEHYEEYHGIITAMQGNAGLSDLLRGWYQNKGDLMSSRNILNILIIGIDATGNEPMVGNSDAMMLASINKEKKTITLCSFLRDSYTYFEVDGAGRFSKLNAAYAEGGAKALIDAIENNYKLKIDYFAAVDFDAFIDVIDAIGGINLTVTQMEAEAIMDYAKITGVPYGENVHLTGEQALYFARMRKIYTTGDIQRTENQRRVINAVIQKAKANLSLTNLTKVVKTLAPHVYTNCSATRLITLGGNAVLGQWYNYQVRSMVAPPESARAEPLDGENWWVWIVDYPFAAQYVQKEIFGETNIVIPDGTESAIDIYEANGGF